MGLKKELDTNTGVIVDYWRVAALFIKAKESMHVHVYGYISKDVRDAGKLPVLQREYQLPLPDFELLEDNIVTYAYLSLKDNPDFAGAVDA